MPIQNIKNDYVIPRGRAYFDPYDASENLTGEFPLGNCPEVTVSISTDKAEHFSSERGMQEKDDAWDVKVTRSGKVNCDNFSPRNSALWLSGTHERKTQADAAVTGEKRRVVQGRIYQLGQTAANPLGVRNVTNITVKQGTTEYNAGTDFNVDPETGRVQIIEGGGIASGAEVDFGYKPVAGTFDSVKTGAKSSLLGALRIVSDNAAGSNRDYYMPKVKLTPGGDLPLITSGTDPVAMEFELEVLKPANAEAMYCDGRPVVV